jgi:ATP-dependent exoDNAse (exonuclease V) beta subunit
MRRPLRGAASETAHARLAATATNGAGLTRDVAMRAGTEIHRLLEDFDLDAEPAAELARQRERALRRVEGEAADATAALIDALGRGSLLARLRELRPSIVARELPVLLPPGADEAGPVGCVEGVLDLVYVDPDSGRYVVADYKTDAEVEGRVEAYAGQLEVYARALREGLGLDEPPRRELWFLRADRIVTLEDDGVHSGSP